MPHIHVHIHTLDAGTSEGAKKAWETRKRHGGSNQETFGRGHPAQSSNAHIIRQGLSKEIQSGSQRGQGFEAQAMAAGAHHGMESFKKGTPAYQNAKANYEKYTAMAHRLMAEESKRDYPEDYKPASKTFGHEKLVSEGYKHIGTYQQEGVAHTHYYQHPKTGKVVRNMGGTIIPLRANSYEHKRALGLKGK